MTTEDSDGYGIDVYLDGQELGQVHECLEAQLSAWRDLQTLLESALVITAERSQIVRLLADAARRISPKRLRFWVAGGVLCITIREGNNQISRCLSAEALRDAMDAPYMIIRLVELAASELDAYAARSQQSRCCE